MGGIFVIIQTWESLCIPFHRWEVLYDPSIIKGFLLEEQYYFAAVSMFQIGGNLIKIRTSYTPRMLYRT